MEEKEGTAGLRKEGYSGKEMFGQFLNTGYGQDIIAITVLSYN